MARWRLGGTVDYHAKVALACPVSATSTAADMIAALDAAQAAAEALLEVPLAFDCVDDDWRLWPVVVVTDNGPAMKSSAVAAGSPGGHSSPTSAPGTDHQAPTA